MALSGKVAVVTGAAMGIGNAMTRVLLQNGAKVRFISVKSLHLNMPATLSGLLCADDRYKYLQDVQLQINNFF